jgi:23S rRNA (adenine2503-C2)-methyltransferase
VVETDRTIGRYDVDRDALAAMLDGEPSYRVEQVWNGLYTRGAALEDLTELPQALRTRLADALPTSLRQVAESVSDGGETIKWLWSLHDEVRIETVLMHYPERSTVCVSTQAGCAMGCSFCATGQAGFDRNLSTGEIVEQVVRARRRAAPRRVSNVVFMGMGEPMANYERTWSAVERLHTDVGISARHLTLSTVGIVPGIARVAKEALPVNLAVSLHAANDALRDELVPINRRYPLAELIGACRAYVDAKNRRLSFEWALIAGTNDRVTDARELATIARPLGAHVNLIALNPTPGYLARGPERRDVVRFRDRLRELGVNVTIRQNRGTAIDAACGQLRATAVNAPARSSSS